MAPSTQMRTMTNANMRQEPSGNAAIAAVVKAGAIVNGWISGELLEAIE